MLISKSKPYDAGDIVSFKLVNGEELVARIVNDGGLAWDLERPTTVAPTAKGIMLIASLMTSDPDFNLSLSKNHVVFHANTTKEVKDYYIQTTTGIQPVSAGVLSGGM